MFCPSCRIVFEAGIDACVKCGGPLVEDPTNTCCDDDDRTPQADDLEMVTVLETCDPGLVALVKSLLEGSGIPYRVLGEATQSLLSTPIFPSIFQVERRYHDEVKALLEDIQESSRE